MIALHPNLPQLRILDRRQQSLPYHITTDLTAVVFIFIEALIDFFSRFPFALFFLLP
jgi:hypothetical protein